jgi:beta-glucosidase/6-phospho-beta-glucosidase/beta-galactosidase
LEQVRGGQVYIKAFTERFGFDGSRISQIPTRLVKDKATVNVPEGALYTTVIDSMLKKGMEA